jgi:hypothetical protein
MLGRAIAYPLAVLVVPAIWFLRGRRDRYPYDIDILLVLPFLIDTIGNALNLYDTVDHWDDANHLVNWAILVSGFGCFLRRLQIGRWETFGLAVGFGAVTAILWELAEYLTFVRTNPRELAGAYRDTLGDLALGLTGSVLAALAIVSIRWRPRRSAAPGRAR